MELNVKKVIDAEKLLTRLEASPLFDNFGEDGEFIKEFFLELIKIQPTEDVVEVRHGEWISVDADVRFKCSICDAEVSTSWDYEDADMFKYCPCCGAKMDKERDEV